MLPALLAVAILTLMAVVVLLLRRPPVAAPVAPDERLTVLLAANLPGQMAGLDARSAALDSHLRAELAGLRSEAATEGTRSREAAETASKALRTEVLGSIQTLGRNTAHRAGTLSRQQQGGRRPVANPGGRPTCCLDATF